ncbi:beta-ketoadipate pathway transcriptionalregulator, PcaR/PcaU/PobR family [Mizugakiibacter sediminis]|uniref:Beta-ketoadipate pathway transcriptionalregulator, PcaR/PcaU/PobR family n=1 Tax=Mizugakiibacter sediminis TaxID=1475481 RepID=A0A0K8QRI0_9GAMM|nr:IclR family transcriptional regulator C-terminal domain-containing protein [Mizugakiibacter sediminis]GAP67505.1 beta-ketoadipate pathway transcriptionalregulator, PcaR/PcaU/PobR family [Mizugakiibacter sediminis]
MAPKPFEESADYVQSLARGLMVLRAFDRELPSPSLSQVAERSGLSRAVARRLLLTLQHLGYVGSRSRSFFLTPRVLELGYSYLSSLDLTELAQQSMEQLSQRVGESCSMAVLDGSDVVYVLRVPVRRVMSVALGVGARLPAFATSLGRAILADMPEAELAAWLRGQRFRAYTPHTIRTASALKAELQRVRAQGYALVVRELEPGLCSIAVPIHAADGRVVAALNVGMPYGEEAPARAVKQTLPAMRETQQAIEQAIRRVGWLPHLAMKNAYG